MENAYIIEFYFYIYLLHLSFNHLMIYICFCFLQELMDESATKIPEVRIAAKQCVAIVDGKQFRLKSRKDVNANFIGVATSSVKHVQEMSNLQSVNK